LETPDVTERAFSGNAKYHLHDLRQPTLQVFTSLWASRQFLDVQNTGLSFITDPVDGIN